jgi:hypothetical protein
MENPLGLVGKFTFQIVVGTVLFLVIGGAAALVWEFTAWLASIGVPYEIWYPAHLGGNFLFYADLVCFVIFIVTEVTIFISELVLYAWEHFRNWGMRR